MTSINNEKAPLTLNQLKATAKGLEVTYAKTVTRVELIAAIAEKKGWADEKPEVIEFLLSGGCIETLPGFVAPAPKKSANNRETSAGGKVQPEAPGARKTPRKVIKSEAERTKKPSKTPSETKPAKTGNQVTIQAICEELGVEGRVARRKLRGSDITKPGDSWTWEAGHADIQKVRELLKK